MKNDLPSLNNLIFEHQKLIEAALNNDGEIPLDSWEENQISIKKKVDNYYEFLKYLEYYQDELNSRANKLLRMRDGVKKTVSRLKDNLKEAAIKVGEDNKLIGEEYTFTVVDAPGKTEYDEKIIPEEYFTKKVLREIDKERVKEDLAMNLKIPGVTKHRTKRLISGIYKGER